LNFDAVYSQTEVAQGRDEADKGQRDERYATEGRWGILQMVRDGKRLKRICDNNNRNEDNWEEEEK
jgi:hypothetical protein